MKHTFSCQIEYTGKERKGNGRDTNTMQFSLFDTFFLSIYLFSLCALVCGLAYLCRENKPKRETKSREREKGKNGYFIGGARKKRNSTERAIIRA